MKERGKKRFCAYCGQSLDECCDCLFEIEIRKILRELALAEEGMTEEWMVPAGLNRLAPFRKIRKRVQQWKITNLKSK